MDPNGPIFGSLCKCITKVSSAINKVLKWLAIAVAVAAVAIAVFHAGAAAVTSAPGTRMRLGANAVYDTRSNLVQKTDARGVYAFYSFDLPGGGSDRLNRLHRIEYNTWAASVPVNTAYASNFTYDKTRVVEIDTENIVHQKYEYDVESRVSKFTQKIKYRENYPMELDYLYDSLDRVTEVKYPAQYGISGSPRKIVAHEYETASRLKKMSYGTTGSWTQHAGSSDPDHRQSQFQQEPGVRV